MPTTKPDRDKLGEYRRKRDFAKTSEPSGVRPRKRRAAKPPRASRPKRASRSRQRRGLAFVIQKHQATSLHFDLRLELDGVMKSWAVPKGLSLDPSVKRLAMEVEDHPLEYNEFEGTIPEGEYGGGTVMIWDRGTFTADEIDEGESDQDAMRRGYQNGKISFTLDGERLEGSFALVRTDRGPKPKWLVIKHKDGHVRRGFDPTEAFDTSVASGRTMDEIAREGEPLSPVDAAGDGIEPMRAAETKKLPRTAGWAFEEMHRGPRVLAYVTPNARKLIPESATSAAPLAPIADALGKLSERTGRGFVLDGVVAEGPRKAMTYFVSDILYDDGDVVLDEAWQDRRRRIESLLAHRRVGGVRLAEVHDGSNSDPVEHALANGWAGIIAKRIESPYRPGATSKDWRRLEF